MRSLIVAGRPPCRHAVQIGPGRRGGRRGVGHHVGLRRGDPHLVEVDAELLRHDLRNLGVEPLPHLGAAMAHQHGAIGIDVHERARLVEVLQGEGDPELDGRERHPLPEKLVVLVEGRDALAPLPVVAGFLERAHDPRDGVVADLHAIGRDVPPAAVKIALAHVQRVQTEPAGDVVHHPFGEHHALRPAETPERRVRDRVGPDPPRQNPRARIVVGVVGMEHGPVADGHGEIGRAAAACAERGVDRQQPAPLVTAIAVLDPDIVALARSSSCRRRGRGGAWRPNRSRSPQAPRGRPIAPPGFPCRRTRRPCAGIRTPRPSPAFPSMAATRCWISVGCCVDERTCIAPPSPGRAMAICPSR